MAKVNTLFSYFTKSPKVSENGANGKSPKRTEVEPSRKVACPYQLYDVVWAKLEGYPYWPALVCCPPDGSRFLDDGSPPCIHVQFFDSSRSWIKLKRVKLFTGPNQVPKMRDPVWKQGVEDAHNALAMERDKRSSLLVVDTSLGGEDMEQDEDKMPKAKKRRTVSESEALDEEYNPEKGEISDDPDVMRTCGKRKRNSRTALSTTKKLSGSSPKVHFPNELQTACRMSSKQASPKVWAHLGFDFLKEGRRRDGCGRLPDHPEFEARTLSVPESFKKSLTPAMKQWWDMKSDRFDVVLFFKVGKFYELYHMDAVIGVEQLGLIYMKGELAHCGFPEISYGRYSESLIQKGYKVARVEQTETPELMEERCRNMQKATKFDKVVKREICRITSLGTRLFGVQDGQGCQDDTPSYLLAFAQKSLKVSGESEFGVCFVDTTVGTFNMGQFHDDRCCSKFRTMIAHHHPIQVLYEKGQVTGKVRQILEGALSAVLKEGLRAEFWDAPKTLQFLRDGRYFEAEGYPDDLLKFLSQDDKMLLTAKDDCQLTVKALGACVRYLSDCLIEEEVLTMRKFRVYTPEESEAQKMILDGVSLDNLEIVRNASGTLEGTLVDTMDFCCTHFGKRLFLQWLCAPLCHSAGICDRQDAVEDLLRVYNRMTKTRKLLKTVPDLERLLAKIHTQGLSRKNHPDSRAVFYEDATYNKRKVGNLLLALQGFKTVQEAIKPLQDVASSFRSKTLSRCLHGDFPDMSDTLRFFDTAFDHEEARREGKITPRDGVDNDYDNAMSRIKVATKALDDYLAEQCRLFRCKVTYFGTGKHRFQLEVPESAHKLADGSYDLQGQRKGYRRYWTTRVKQLTANLVLAEEATEAALADIMRRMFENFDRRRKMWEGAVKCLSILDCLMSLAEYSASLGDVACTPRVLTSGKPRLYIKAGRHPCLHMQGFVPNDICLGHPDATLALMTGPNMGGKSTLMRQTGLTIIIAQMGAKVPAQACELTPVDRIFTRLGARDKIVSGQHRFPLKGSYTYVTGESTFFVEVNETCTILKYATSRSLVLLDELGRGTSTHDGMAIAHAVVKELSQHICCPTLFSTHYHHLVQEFGQTHNIYLGHMACVVENENSQDPTEETIRFLYKFVGGPCPKSYGFNAAKLAGISVEIIRNAFRKSREQAVQER